MERTQIQTNVTAVPTVTNAALPHFRGRRAVHFIQLSSMRPAGRAPYSAANRNVGGYSELLARAAGPLAVNVILVVPGGFLTAFAVPFTRSDKIRSECEATVEAMSCFRSEYESNKRGDPAQAAAGIVNATALSDPNLRFLHCADGYYAAEVNNQARPKTAPTWKDHSRSIEVEQDP